MMTSSGLQCEICVVHFSWLKLKVVGFRVKFVKVYEWFPGCDRLKIIFKSRKQKITKLFFILKIIKNYHYISLICLRKLLKCINESNIF